MNSTSGLSAGDEATFQHLAAVIHAGQYRRPELERSDRPWTSQVRRRRRDGRPGALQAPGPGAFELGFAAGGDMDLDAEVSDG
ncbi:MAG: hypothetical protein R6V28_16210 [Nitriliruptoraceae bacterium]